MKAFRAAILSLLLAGPAFGQTMPILPQLQVDTTLPADHAGVADRVATTLAELQDAFDDAVQNGADSWIVEVPAGITITGTVVVRNKIGTQWVIFRSGNHANLPAGIRVTPADASDMAKLSNTGGNATNLWFEFGAHNVRVIGIEITNTTEVPGNALVHIGYNYVLDTYPPTLGDLPTNIILDRVYIHGTPTGEFVRGVALNCAYGAVIDSDIREFHHTGSDAQAIAGWGGPGPFKIDNNELQGAGENVIFGGADAVIDDVIPSDITFTRNHVFKPLTWDINDPSYAGIPWSVKNSIELKCSARVLIEGNHIENCWPSGQSGAALMLTVRNQGGTNPWATIDDTTIRKNLITGAYSAFSISTSDDQVWGSQTMNSMWIHDNLFRCYRELPDAGSVNSMMCGTLGTPKVAGTIRINNNSVIYEGGQFPTTGLNIGDTPLLADYLIVEDNIFHMGTYGVAGTSALAGTNALNAYATDYEFGTNVIMNDLSLVDGNDYNSALYVGNFFAANVAAVQFTNAAGGDYSLAPGSPYKNAGSDGEDPGIDNPALQAALAGGESPLRLYINSAAGLLPIEVAE